MILATGIVTVARSWQRYLVTIGYRANPANRTYFPLSIGRLISHAQLIPLFKSLTAFVQNPLATVRPRNDWLKRP